MSTFTNVTQAQFGPSNSHTYSYKSLLFYLVFAIQILAYFELPNTWYYSLAAMLDIYSNNLIDLHVAGS